MSKHQGRLRRASHTIQALKDQLLRLVSSLDPVAALNHLQYEGLVSSKDSDLQEAQTETRDIRYLGGHQKPRHDIKAAARKELEELADNDKHTELLTVVSALEAFRKLHDKVHHQAEGQRVV